MGFNFTGITIDKNFEKDPEEVLKFLGLPLTFEEEIDFDSGSGYKDGEYFDIFFSDIGTSIYSHEPIQMDPSQSKDCSVLSFMVSETSMAFFMSLDKNGKRIREVIDHEGDISNNIGEPLEIEKDEQIIKLNAQLTTLKKDIEIKKQKLPELQYDSLAEFLGDRLEPENYSDMLGMINQVQQDLQDLSDKLLPPKEQRTEQIKELFPRGEPRVILYIDDLDRCPLAAGGPQLEGCPDTDEDGTADPYDRCPAIAGPPESLGCPPRDTDLDGVNDHEDNCPLDPGPPSRKGCPLEDSDEDGILDEDDRCPGLYGQALFEGCPDTDGDGTPDFQHAGADTDGDGIPDDVEGSGDTDNDGTPDFQDTDADGDGIPDEEDWTRDTDGDGSLDFQDPDADGDGIPDINEGPTGTDTDGDGLPDYRDTDADGDGIPDSVDIDDADSSDSDNGLNRRGRSGRDVMTGSSGDDTLRGRGGDDKLKGKKGDDRLFGNGGGDRLVGGKGDDILNGGGGTDTLIGNAGDDILLGKGGRDRLIGGAGEDILTGGGGQDTFVLGRADSDIITDFQNGQDRILLKGSLQFADLTISQQGEDTVIALSSNGNAIVTLEDVSASLITAADFS